MYYESRTSNVELKFLLVVVNLPLQLYISPTLSDELTIIFYSSNPCRYMVKYCIIFMSNYL